MTMSHFAQRRRPSLSRWLSHVSAFSAVHSYTSIHLSSRTQLTLSMTHMQSLFFFPFLPPSPFLPAVSSPLPCPSSVLVGPYYTSSCAAGYRLFCTQDKLYQLPHKSRDQHDPDATRQGCPRPPFIQHICQLIHADTLGHSGSSHPLRFAPRCKEINLMLFVT